MDQQAPFGQTEPKQHKQKPQDEAYLGLSREISELLSRLRLLEERYANVRREHQTTSQNMIENHQSISKQIRKSSDDILAIKREFNEVREQLATMQGELTDTAKAHELKALQRYIDLWEPMTFVTREEAERLIQAAVEKTKGL